MVEQTRRRRGFFGWVRAVDDGVFAVEQAIVALALMAITVLMFVNVLARRIQAQDSKVGAVIAKLGGITDLETRAWIDANVAPWVSSIGAFAIFAFGYYSWRRFRHAREGLPPPPKARTLGIGALVAIALIALGWGFARLFSVLESSVVFASLFGAASAGYALFAVLKRTPRWPIRAAAGIAVGGLVVWFCLTWFPVGYTWTSKVSLLLLLWVGMLAASICVHEGKHIRLEALGKLAPEKLRRYLTALGFLVAAAFCALMTWLGVAYTFEPVASDDETLTEIGMLFGTRWAFGAYGAYGLGGRIEGTDIPDWVGAFSIVVGFGIATLRLIGAGVSWALGGDYGAPPPDTDLEEARKVAARESRSASAGQGATREEATNEEAVSEEESSERDDERARADDESAAGLGSREASSSGEEDRS